MTAAKVSLTILLILYIGDFVQGLVLQSSGTAGPLCYYCSNVNQHRECNHIVQCGVHEKCFGRAFKTSSNQTLFSFGCESISACAVRRSFHSAEDWKSNIHQNVLRSSNGDIQTCNQCCEGDYCNLKLCTTERCLVCDDVINPSDCNISQDCKTDHICYTEQIYINKEKRFRMGCIPKNGCISSAQPITLTGHILGKRNNEVPDGYRFRRSLPADHTYCAKCCTGANCNRNLCTSTTVINQYQLVAPPPLLPCQDYDETSCRSGLVDANFCQDLANKRLFCPRTCNTCAEGGMPQPVTTPISTTVNICMENRPIQCQQYKDFFCDPSNTAGIDACPVTCKKPGCSSVEGGIPHLVKTTASTAVNPVTACEDPVPPCQCEYLQKEVQICYDGNQELLKFCCFYCKKVRDPNWTCSTTDRTFCDAYEKPYAQKIAGKNITCFHQ